MRFRHTNTWPITTFRLGLSIFTVILLLVAAAPGVGGRLVNDQIAFASHRDGNWEIYIMDVITGLVHNLTQHPADDRAPRWSPDGRQIAFYSDRNSDLRYENYVMNSDGTNPRSLIAMDSAVNSWSPAWSPDGRHIVFIQGFRAITIARLDSQERRTVGSGFAPVWSPDGTQILYYADPGGRLNGDIYIVNADGTGSLNLTNHPANDWGPAWSPDGAWIAFASVRDGNSEIYVMDGKCARASSRNGECSDTIRRLTDDPAIDYAPSWSPDGSLIAFESIVSGRAQLYIINADSSSRRQITVSSADDTLPVWLPNSQASGG